MASTDNMFADYTTMLTMFGSTADIRTLFTGSDPAAPVVIELMNAVRKAERQMETAANSMENTLARVRKAVENGVRLNSLGELQRTSADYDQAIVAREQAMEMLRLAVRALQSTERKDEQPTFNHVNGFANEQG